MKTLKEIRLSPNIALHDMQTKAKQTDNFLAKGIQVRLNLEVRGRMIAKQDISLSVIKEFMGLLKNAGISTPVSDKGKTLTCVINPKKGITTNETKKNTTKNRALLIDKNKERESSDNT